MAWLSFFVQQIHSYIDFVIIIFINVQTFEITSVGLFLVKRRINLQRLLVLTSCIKCKI